MPTAVPESAPEDLHRNLERIHADLMVQRMEVIVSRLHDLATAVERIRSKAVALSDRDDPRGAYGGLAAQAQHQVLWGLANLSMEDLARSAAAADVQRAIRRHLTSEAPEEAVGEH